MNELMVAVALWCGSPSSNNHFEVRLCRQNLLACLHLAITDKQTMACFAAQAEEESR